MKLPIITVPDPVLRQVSKRVQKLDEKSVQFIYDLGETLVKKDDPPGVGLSAIQVANPLRVFYTYLPPKYEGQDFPKDTHQLELTAFINPVIVKHSDTVTLGPNPKKPLLEGCLSIPSLYGPVWRYNWIDIEYDTFRLTDYPINRSTKPVKRHERFTGFTSRVIQHEYDHLEGILFTDYVIGVSPMKSFRSLGEGGQLYFDDGRSLVPLANPSEFIQW